MRERIVQPLPDHRTDDQQSAPAGFIMGGSGADVKRWELPSLLARTTASPVMEKSRKPLTAKEIEVIEETAHQEGYNKGLESGYAAGMAEGIKQGHQQGYAAGHSEGFTAGHAEGLDKAQKQKETLLQLIEHLIQPIGQLEEEVEKMMVSLTIEVARRLVNQHLELDPALTAAAVREAIDALGGQPPRDGRLVLNPLDLEAIGDWIRPDTESGHWRLVADAELQRGDCRVITENGQVDALLDTRQSSIARGLLGNSR